MFMHLKNVFNLNQKHSVKRPVERTTVEVAALLDFLSL
jgi:hypothetical protein